MTATEDEDARAARLEALRAKSVELLEKRRALTERLERRRAAREEKSAYGGVGRPAFEDASAFVERAGRGCLLYTSPSPRD